MNAALSPLPVRWLLLVLLGLGCLSLLTPPLLATDPTAMVQTASPAMTLQANTLKDAVGNRSRMIQLSLVFVVFSCALLWWRRV